MRPHRLTVQAFGPFGGHDAVDFDALTVGGLFLFRGDTGAGKTSILDAVCFALYGRVPSDRDRAAGLRSHHADEQVATEVVLEATVRGRRLRVTRRPAQPRPGRGGRTVADPARVLVEELSGTSWVTVSTRVGEADEFLSDQLGMSADQFFQVVLLPQGQFAQFLDADDRARKEVLRRLFRTDRFGQVERWFADRAAAAQRACEQARQRRDLLLASLQQLVGRTDDRDAPAAVVAQLRLQAARAEADERLTGEAERAAVATSETEARLAERQRRRRIADAALARLTADQDAAAAAAAELEAARKAAALGPVVARLDRSKAAARAARKDADRFRSRLSRLAPGVVSASTDPADWPELVQDLRADQTRIEAALTLESGLPTLDEAVAVCRGRADTVRVALEEARRQAGCLPTALAAGRDQLAAARAAEATLPMLEQACRVAETRAVAAAELAETRRLLTDAESAAAELASERYRRQRAVGELRERRLDGNRGELARLLTPGDPCPVCGATDHPELAVLPPDHVTRQQEADAREALEVAESRYDTARSHRDGLRQRGAGLAGVLGPAESDDPARLVAAAAVARTDLGAAARLAAATTDHESAIRELEARQGRLTTESGRLTRDLATAEADLERATADLATAAAQVAAARQDHPSVAARSAALGAAADALTDAEEAARIAAAAERQVADDCDLVAQAAAEAGFADSAAALAAVRPDDRVRELAAVVTADREAWARVRAELADPDLAVALDPAADPTAAALAHRRAAEAARSAASRRAVATDRLARAIDLQRQVDSAVADLAHLAAEQAELTALAELVQGRGANTRNMTLSSFVLAARLEAVATAASCRLATMSDDRYTLEHTDEVRDGRRRAGLGLRVRDAWTGRSRATASLSGGEKFMASLALALGLADVVTAEAGGTPVDTLFVDEGFGSLDEESLETVMSVLDGLRDGGRAVGVVSHVRDLQHRISTQVVVAKGQRSGSRISQTVAA